MQEKNTIARPYAIAAFKQAQLEKSQDEWSTALGVLEQIVSEPKLKAFLDNPQVEKEDLTGLILDVVKDNFSTTQQNLLKVLADNKRLAYVPQIKKIFMELKANEAKQVAVEVKSAYELDDITKFELEQFLHAEFEREIDMTVEVEPALIGGVIIKAGDLVIDSSMRGRLNQLATKMSI